MPLESGKGLLHYRIVRLIGQGGMGQVFLAEDTRLHRKVALKVLPGEMVSHADRLARFRREAQSLASLNHPHIVTVHSVEEAEGTHFLIMELVEGTSLDHLVSPGGLELEKVFDVGIALSDALAAAHEQGIIHRDLKPANVMITRDGRVKVLDFGLAKLAPRTPEGIPGPGVPGTAGTLTPTVPMDRSLTATGMVVGTIPYMSPEQVGGEAADARTDIFALGVILYELTTGRRPFQGKNQAETISSILRDAPRPLTEARQEAPRELARIIDHCLQKNPRDRFQTARDVFNELRALRKELETESTRRRHPPLTPAETRPGTPATEPPYPPDPAPHSNSPVAAARGRTRWRWVWLTGGIAAIAVVGLLLLRGIDRTHQQPEPSAVPTGRGAGPEAKSIAVLPFVNMSDDKANEYFADGLAEELLNALAKNPSLRVAARTSSFFFKDKDVDIAEIGRRLNVEAVLEGSVRKEGDRVRITVQLINAGDGYHLWSETYNRHLQSIFAVQEDIARSVMSSLKTTLSPSGIMEARPANIEAYNLSLKGDYFWKRWGPGDLEKARDLYEQAVTLDPDYARAWSRLGTVYANMVESDRLPREEGLRLAHDAYERALAIGDSTAEAHAALGWMKMQFEWDWPGAEEELAQALALNPNSVYALSLAAVLAGIQGRLAESNELWLRLVGMDPLSSVLYNNAAIGLFHEGRLDEAQALVRTMLEISSEREGGHALMGGFLLAQGRKDEALQEYLREPSEENRLWGLTEAYYALGRKADSDTALTSYIDKYHETRPFSIACLHAYRGEPDPAFEWLDRAFASRARELAWIKVEPDLRGLRGDPRWQLLLQKMRLAG